MKNGEDDAQECKVSRSTQANGSVNYCESCAIAGEAVLRMVDAIEHTFVENKLISVAVAERYARL